MQFLTTAETIKRNFVSELRNASKNGQTSLRFIEHQLPSEKLVMDGDIFQVLVIGGTVFKKALFKKTDNQITALDEYSEEHPPLSTKEMFLEFISGQLYHQSNIVSINFAFPLDPLVRKGRLDGVLMSATKSHNTFSGLIGNIVGETIEEYITIKLQRKTLVSIANDTVCLLLSRPDAYPLENLAGAIMGTGTNTTFIDNNSAINIQSGGFSRFTPSNECLGIDKKSLKPGASLFEKEIAGAYLYKQFNYLLEKNQINHPLINSTKELYVIMLNSQDNGIKEIASSLFEKSAAFFAGQIAGLAAFKNHPLIVIMEGSIYWENQNYREYFNKYLSKLSYELEIKIVRVENSSIIGAAKLIA